MAPTSTPRLGLSQSVPLACPALDYGGRLGSWTLTPDSEGDVAEEIHAAIVKDADPLFEGVNTPSDMVGFLESRERTRHDINDLEALAYSLLLAGSSDRARSTLEQIPPKVERDIPWELDLGRRTQRVLKAMNEDVNAAKRLLCSWRSEMARALGLPELHEGAL